MKGNIYKVCDEHNKFLFESKSFNEVVTHIREYNFSLPPEEREEFLVYEPNGSIIHLK